MSIYQDVPSFTKNVPIYTADGLIGGSHSQDGFDDFSETFSSFPACDEGGEMFHALSEVEDVLDACRMRKALKHGFVVERISAEDETILVVI